jgi:hypothetical protein
LVEELEVEWIAVDRDSVECVVYDSYEGDTFAVSATTHADIGFEGLVDRRDAHRLDHPWEVTDAEWTDDSALVRAEGELTLHFNLIVAGNDVQDVTFDYAEVG